MVIKFDHMETRSIRFNIDKKKKREREKDLDPLIKGKL